MNAKTTALLIILTLPAVAALNFSLQPATHTAHAGDNITLALSLSNTHSLWGFSLALTEQPNHLAYQSATPSARLSHGLNGNVTAPNSTTTLYSLHHANTTGITPGNGTLYTLAYTIPATAPEGVIHLNATELQTADANGTSLNATITNATIRVVGNQTPLTQFHLPTNTYGLPGQTVNVTFCITHLPTTPLTAATATIQHNPAIAHATNVTFHAGNGDATLESGITNFSIANLSITNADCEQGTGSHAATITYHLEKLGVSPLTFTNANAEESSTPFSIQSTHAEDGVLSVSVTNVTKSCEASPGVVVQNTTFTVTYKISNPFTDTNIGGVEEMNTFNASSFALTNLTALAGTLENITGNGTLRTALATITLPLFSGASTFNAYAVNFTALPNAGTHNHTFGIAAVQVSDDQSNALDTATANCSVRVIPSCNTDDDCQDNNVCNGEEQCVNNACTAGTALACDDNNANTFDTCDPIDGCQHTTPPSSGGTGGAGGGGSGSSGNSGGTNSQQAPPGPQPTFFSTSPSTTTTTQEVAQPAPQEEPPETQEPEPKPTPEPQNKSPVLKIIGAFAILFTVLIGIYFFRKPRQPKTAWPYDN